MKGFLEDANYSIGLLDEGATLADVIDNCIYEHTHVSFVVVFFFFKFSKFSHLVILSFQTEGKGI